MSKAQSNAARAVAAVALLGYGAVLSAHRLGDFDLPWHLANGRQIAQTHHLARVDDFAQGARPIGHHEFVSDLLLYAVNQLGGTLALQTLGGALACLIGGLLFWQMRAYGTVAFVVTSAALASANPWILTRPATFSFVFVALTVAAIDVHRAAPAAKRGRLALLSLAPLHLLWANTHGFVVIGLATTMGYAAYRGLCALLGTRIPRLFPPADGVDLPASFGAAGLALIATCMNSAGPRLLAGPAAAVRDQSAVTEWAHTTARFLLNDHPGALVYALLVALALLVGRGVSSRVPSAFDVGLVMLGFGLSWFAVRLIAPASILVAPLVARRLSTRVHESSVVVAASLVATCLVAPFAFLMADTSRGVGFEPRHFPEGAVRFIRDAHPKGKMWNFMPFGGYLVWRLYPDFRVLVDGRSGWVHDPELFRQAIDSDRNPTAFASLVREHDLQWAVCRAWPGVPHCGPVARSTDWTMVYWDDVSAVYVRRAGANADLAQKGYRTIRHLTEPGDMLALAVSRGPVRDAFGADMDLASRQRASGDFRLFMQGCAAIAKRDEAAFEAVRAQISHSTLDPDLAGALVDAWSVR